MRNILTVFVLVVFICSPLLSVVKFNGGNLITTNGQFDMNPPSKVGSKGGLILYFNGVLDSATLSLEIRPFDSAQETALGGGPIFQALEGCEVTTLPAECRIATGPEEIRLDVQGGGGSLAFMVTGWRFATVVTESIESTGSGGGSLAWIDNNVDAFGFDPPDFVVPALTLGSGNVSLVASTLEDNDMTDHAIVWPTPVGGFAARIGASDSGAGLTYAGVRVEVGAGRWTFHALDQFFSRIGVGLVNLRSLAVASFRPFISSNVGLGSDLGVTGSLVAGSAILTFNAAGIQVANSLVMHMPSASGNPVGLAAGDCRYDLEQGLCCFSGVSWFEATDNSTACL